MPDGTSISVRLEFDNPNDAVVQSNFTALRQRWSEIWPRILRRAKEMKQAYGYGDIPIRGDSNWFGLQLPTQPINQDADWNVMLQADEAGWLLDFKGWKDAGGQEVLLIYKQRRCIAAIPNLKCSI